MRIIGVLSLLLLLPSQVKAVTCTSNGTGNWNATGTWTGCTGGNGSTANTPGSNDTAIITGAHTVTVTADETVSALEFAAASTAGAVSVNSSITLTVTNALTITSNAGANVAATVSGSGTITAGSITIGTDATVSSNTTYTTTLTSTLSSLSTSGNLTIASFIGNNVNRIGNATFTLSGGATTVSGTVTTTNEGANNTSTLTMSNSTLNLSGATPFSLSGTGTNTITLNGTSAVVNYNSSSAQTVYGTTYTTLKINNAHSSGATLGAATTTTTLTIGDVTGSSNFNDGGFQLTCTGTLNLTSGTFKLGGASATTWPAFATRNISSGTTVEYASTAAQTYSTVPTYHHLTFSGASTKSPSSTAFTVNGNLTISAGTMTAPSGNLTLLGNFSNSGTFTHNSGTVIFAGADSSTQSLTGSTTFNNFTASTNTNGAGRALQFAGNSTTTVSGTWTITGYSGKIITLQSSDTNNWTINPTAASVTYADVYRSTNTGTTFCATYSTKDANTSGWSVSAGDTCITAFNCESNTASGNWNAAGSWTNCDGGTPNSDDTAAILNGHAITLNTNAEIIRIDIQNGGTFAADASSRTLTLNGTSGTLFTLGGTGTFTANNSTVIITPDAAITIISGSPAFYNLTLSPTITADRIYSLGSAFSVTNNLSINPTAASTTRTLTLNMGGNLTVTGTTTLTGTTTGASVLDTRPDTTDYNLSTGLLDIASAGTLDAAGSASTITLTGTSGTLFTRAGTFTSGSSTVIFNPDAAVTLTSGTFTSTNSFYNVSLTPAISTAGRTYTFGSGAIAATGDFTIQPSGTQLLTVNVGATTTIATGKTLSLTRSETATTSLSTSASNYALTTGHLSIATGATLTANDSVITVNGNWTNNGTFAPNTSEVIFATATTATLTGDTTFTDFTSTTQAKTLQFTAGDTFTINGLLTLTGAADPNYVYLTSTTTSPWYINHQGTESITYAHISYGGCSGSTDIDVSDGTSYDGGNNGTCWIFPAPPPTPTPTPSPTPTPGPTPTPAPGVNGAAGVQIRGGVQIR